MENGVRFAETEEELQASLQLRYKVYVEGMGRLKDKGDHELKELRDELDYVARAVVAIKDGVAIGTLRLFWGGDAHFDKSLIEAYNLSQFLKILEDRDICIIERLMVDEKHRGSPIALQMYKVVWDFTIKNHIEAAFLDCEPHHLNAYLKLGFRPFAKTFSYPGIGLVIPMIGLPGDDEHLRQVGSPFSIVTNNQVYKYTNILLDIIKGHTDILPIATSDKEYFLEQIYSDSRLQSNPKPKIFDSLSKDEVDQIISKSIIIKCEKGDHVIEINNSAKTMFVLLSGFVEVRQSSGELMAIVSPGEVIGEIAFFLHVPRMANIVAATDDVRILSLDEASISRILKFEHAVGNKILMNLCRTLCYRIINNAQISGQ